MGNDQLTRKVLHTRMNSRTRSLSRGGDLYCDVTAPQRKRPGDLGGAISRIWPRELAEGKSGVRPTLYSAAGILSRVGGAAMVPVSCNTWLGGVKLAALHSTATDAACSRSSGELRSCARWLGRCCHLPAPQAPEGASRRSRRCSRGALPFASRKTTIRAVWASGGSFRSVFAGPLSVSR